MTGSICYFLSHYVSHRQAGLRYRDCLTGMGIRIVDRPDGADLAVIHNEPWSIPGYYRMFPALGERPVIAYAVWETETLPEHYRFTLARVDGIWTASSYCASILAQAGRPVTVVPHVVDVPRDDAAAARRLRERLGVGEEEFLFYTITSAGNVRKGVAEAVRAFGEAFPNGEAKFLVKSVTPMPPRAAATPGVIPLAEVVSDEELHAIHGAGDCFVSAHHSEGWGMAISDAMACGNLVVATAYGGNMDFMNEHNALPVKCEVDEIHPDDIRRQPNLLQPGMRWAYVDHEDLERQMRRAFEEWELLQPLRTQARLDMARFAAPRVAERLAAILQP